MASFNQSAGSPGESIEKSCARGVGFYKDIEWPMMSVIVSDSPNFGPLAMGTQINLEVIREG